MTAVSSPYNTKPSWKVEKVSVTPEISRSRKGPKARTWTYQEETYLLQSRSKRLPYKSIAAKLRKSELACRLHYHQLTVARQSQPSLSAEETVNSPEVSRCHNYPSPITREQVHQSSLHRPRNAQQKLPSLTLLPPIEHLLHQRSRSLPCFMGVWTCPSSYRHYSPVHDQLALPPSKKLLNPFEMVRAQSPVPASSPSEQVSRPAIYHRATTSSTSMSTNRLNIWTPVSSRSSSVSSVASVLLPSSPASVRTPLSSSQRCSVQSILNHE